MPIRSCSETSGATRLAARGQGARLCAGMAAPSALSATEMDALRGLFKQTYGRHVIRPAVQGLLVAYFAGRGESVAVLSLIPDPDDDAAWVREWHAYASGAGVKDEADQMRLTEWLRFRSAKPKGGSVTAGLAKIALTSLEEDGVTLSSAQIAKLEKRLLEGEAGAEEDQCVCADCAFILHLGRAASIDEKAEWTLQFNALGGRQGKVNITRFGSYIKLHEKTDDEVVTLHRALRNEKKYAQWLGYTTETLEQTRLPKASLRLVKKKNWGDPVSP